jgi:hypothetical protein
MLHDFFIVSFSINRPHSNRAEGKILFPGNKKSGFLEIFLNHRDTEAQGVLDTDYTDKHGLKTDMI